jgi:hypothetical protein
MGDKEIERLAGVISQSLYLPVFTLGSSLSGETAKIPYYRQISPESKP